MKIKSASKEDAKIINEIESVVFAGDTFALSKSSIRYHLKHNVFFIAYEDTTPLGYILWLERKSYFRLYSLAILPEHQGKRVASELLSYSFENLTCKDFSLEVNQSNEKAISLYKKFGFDVLKSLPEYYSDGDGFLMKRKSQKS